MVTWLSRTSISPNPYQGSGPVVQLRWSIFSVLALAAASISDMASLCVDFASVNPIQTQDVPSLKVVASYLVE